MVVFTMSCVLSSDLESHTWVTMINPLLYLPIFSGDQNTIPATMVPPGGVSQIDGINLWRVSKITHVST
jgi:hypothetical protein